MTNRVSACLVPACADDVLIKATDENTRYVFRSHLSRALHSILVGKACKHYTKINTQTTGLLFFYYRSACKVKYESLARTAYFSRFMLLMRAFQSLGSSVAVLFMKIKSMQWSRIVTWRFTGSYKLGSCYAAPLPSGLILSNQDNGLRSS